MTLMCTSRCAFLTAVHPSWLSLPHAFFFFCSEICPLDTHGASSYSAGVLEVRTTVEQIEVVTSERGNQTLSLRNQVEDDENSEHVTIKASEGIVTKNTGGAVITKNKAVFFNYEEKISNFHMQIFTSPDKPIEMKIWRRTTKYVGFTIELNSDNDVPNELPPTCCDRYCVGARDPRHPCSVKIVFKTRNLRRARDWGMEIIHGLLFPLFSVYGSELVSTVLFLISLVSCILSSYTFASEAKHGRYPSLEVVQFSLSLAFLVLATVDLFYNMRSCLLGKALFRRICKCLLWFKNSPNEVESKVHCCCFKATRQESNRVRITNRSQRCCQCIAADTQDNPGKLTQTDRKQTRMEKVKDFFTKYMLDILRIIIVEALIYPSVICDVLDNASSRTYDGTFMQRFKFGRLIFSAAKIIVLVYLIRLFVVGSTISSLEQIRRGDVEYTVDPVTKKKKKKKHSICSFSMFDSKDGSKRSARKGLVLEIFFLIHIFGQMLSQGLMIGAIWYKVICENPKPTPAYVVFISPFTWVMIVLGFLLPILGVFTFFIPTYVWAQEFPIDYMVSMLSALKKCGPGSIKEQTVAVVQKIAKVVNTIENDLKKRKMHTCAKIFFPFYTPHLSILSCLYYLPFAAFITFYFIGQLHTGEYILCDFSESVNATAEYPNGRRFSLGWFIYFVIFVSLLNIFNIVVVLIGFWWMCIVPTCGLELMFVVSPFLVCIIFCYRQLKSLSYSLKNN